MEFENKEIRRNVLYKQFANGRLQPQSIEDTMQRRVGMIVKQSCGLDATLIAYRKSNDIDVRFSSWYCCFVRKELPGDGRRETIRKKQQAICGTT